MALECVSWIERLLCLSLTPIAASLTSLGVKNLDSNLVHLVRLLDSQRPCDPMEEFFSCR